MIQNNSQNEAKKIREKYVAKKATELDALKRLDEKVKRPAKIFSYIFGSVGAIVLGSGMSLVMTDIGTHIGIENAMVPGIIIGVAGLAIACVNYPIYKGILNGRKKKYSSDIIALSDKIIEN